MKKGQAVLLLLLVVAVALGLGLSIISQSTTDVRISQQEQAAARTFNAAEAGIETALQDISVAGGNLIIDNIPVSFLVTGQDFLESQYQENESAQVILDGNANTITVNWVDEGNEAENPGSCSGVSAASGQTAASLLITVVTDSYQVKRYGVNACALNAANNLVDVATAGNGKYLRSFSFDTVSGDRLVRIRPLYNLTSLWVSGANALPNQAYLIDSSAQAVTQETKAIQVTRLEPGTPPAFDYVLFSGGNLVQ